MKTLFTNRAEFSQLNIVGVVCDTVGLFPPTMDAASMSLKKTLSLHSVVLSPYPPTKTPTT